MATQENLDAVQKLYISYLGRPGDEAGLEFWANAIESGISTLEMCCHRFYAYLRIQLDLWKFECVCAS